MNHALKETAIKEFPLIKRGKVRDMYDLKDYYLMVATDRISAYDVVMPDSVPEKGTVLNQFSLFWFDVMASVVPNHVISADVNDYPKSLAPYHEMLEGRSMLVKKCDPLPIECVVRGYITGSGWKSYLKDQSVCGIQLPSGLIESDQLPTPIFTPSTKEEGEGAHDINISFEEAAKLVGGEIAEKVKALSIAIYQKGSEIAAEKGIIIADTKFEFGLLDGEIILIDEVLTPDSSRFWPKETYAPGGGQKSFDKQYLRDYLTSIKWDKNPPAPKLPEEIITRTREKYVEALKLVTGSSHGL